MSNNLMMRDDIHSMRDALSCESLSHTHTHTHTQHAGVQVHYVFDPGNVGEDQQVKQLASDLRSIEMVMSAVLTPEKLRSVAIFNNSRKN